MDATNRSSESFGQRRSFSPKLIAVAITAVLLACTSLIAAPALMGGTTPAATASTTYNGLVVEGGVPGEDYVYDGAYAYSRVVRGDNETPQYALGTQIAVLGTQNDTMPTLSIVKDCDITVSGSTTTGIRIAPGVTANVTLSGLNSTAKMPINLVTNSTVSGNATAQTNGSEITKKTTLNLYVKAGTSNVLRSAYYNDSNPQTPSNEWAGIRCGEGSVLNIDSTVTGSEEGTLAVYSGLRSAAIGGGPLEAGGDITINGSTLSAYSQGPTQNGSGAAIGGGHAGDGGSITINGGKIHAEASYHGAPIGGGCTYTGGMSRGATLSSYATSPFRDAILNRHACHTLCGNITINGGLIQAVGKAHTNAFGKGCGGDGAGQVVRITGGTLLPSSVDGWKDIGAPNGYVIITGGSINCVADKFEGLGNTAYNTGDVFTWNDITEKYGSNTPDATGSRLPEKDKVFMVTIDLSSDGYTNEHIVDWDFSLNGKHLDYGSPYSFDNGKLYLWLPGDAVGKEAKVEMSIKTADGKVKELEDLFVPQLSSSGSFLKQYAPFDMPEDFVNANWRKYYDGTPLESYNFSSVPVPARDGKSISNQAMTTSTWQEMNDDGTEKGETQTSTYPSQSGKYQIAITSTQYSNEAGFKNAYWGHRSYTDAEILPSPSSVSVTSATWESGENASDFLEGDFPLHLAVDVTSGTFEDGTRTATTCTAPTGTVSFDIDGKSVQKTFPLVFSGKGKNADVVTDTDGRQHTVATISLTEDDLNGAVAEDGTTYGDGVASGERPPYKVLLVSYEPDKNYQASSAATGFSEPTTQDITFDGNGENSSVSYESLKGTWTYPYDKDLPASTRTGYQFASWNTEPDGSGTEITTGDIAEGKTATTKLQGEQTLYAQWIPNTFTVSFDANGGDGDMAGLSFTYDEEQRLAASTMTKTGYTFLGWNTSSDGSGDSIADEQSVKNLTDEQHGEVVLYAQWSPNEYEVSFDANGGAMGGPETGRDVMEPLACVYDEQETLPSNEYAKTGYTFTGWNRDREGHGEEFADKSEIINLTTAVDGRVTLYAQWSPNNYSISFDKNTGSGDDMEALPMTYDVPKNLPPTGYAKTGYTFAGWALEANPSEGADIFSDGGEVSNLASDSGSEVVLYAQWNPNSYYIAYDGNGSNVGDMPEQPMIYDTAANLKPNTFSKTGYTFAGWNTQRSGIDGNAYTDAEIVNNLVPEPDGHITLYAQWEPNSYHVFYDPNTGDGERRENGEIGIYDEGFFLEDNVFSKTGYTFAGWNTAANGNGTSFEDKGSFENLTDEPSGEVVLYAQWIPNKYSIHLDANTGTGEQIPDMTMTYDVPVGLPACSYSKEGYVFAGWNDAADGSGARYDDEAQVENLISTPNGEITLYAQWAKNSYFIDFDSNTGTGKMDTQKAFYDVPANLPKCSMSKTGYAFAGWNTAADGSGSSFADGEQVSNLTSEPDGTVLLYAQWTPNSYSVSFDANSGFGETVAEQQNVYDVEDHAPQCSYTKTGYTFTSWNTAADGSGQSIPAEGAYINLTDAIDGNVVLYAQWNANDYGISFAGNSGIGAMDDVAVTYDETVALPRNAFSKMGYHFVGWAIFPDGGSDIIADGDSVSNLSSEPNGNVTLYAQWAPNFYKIALLPNMPGDDRTTLVDAVYDSFVSLPALPYEKEGYTFTGWNAEPDGSGEDSVADQGSVINLADQEGAQANLHAQWQKNEYTVSFDANSGEGVLDDIRLTYDEPSKLPASPMNKQGYTFAGWNTEPDGNGNTYGNEQEVSNLTSTPDGKVVLYAQYGANDYTISFDSNGVDGIEVPQSVAAKYDQDVILPDNIPSREGYTFVEWNANEDGSGPGYAPGENVKNLVSDANGSTVLHAVWKANAYVVRYDANGGEGKMDDMEMSYDEAKNLDKVLYEKTGHDFTGWNTKSDGSGQSFADGEEVRNLSAGDGDVVTLYAQWAPQVFKVVFTDGTGNVIDEQNVAYGNAALEPATPSRDGYDFAGWNADFSNVTSDMEIHAMWNQVQAITQAGDVPMTVVAIAGSMVVIAVVVAATARRRRSA